jgi:glycosyltransferase involved in cell wall biosynthesis
MKITAYSLHEHAALVHPASEARAWIKEGDAVSRLALSTASGEGWELLCPHAFEVIWNGGPSPDDITIRLEAPDMGGPAFVQSQLGAGLLTFHAGYQLQIEGPNSLWVRGPVNQPKDGLSPLEQMVDTSVLPSTVVVIWKFLRPDQTVRFERGEAFAVLVPYPTHYAGRFETKVVKPEDAHEMYAQEMQQRIQGPAMQEIVERLRRAADLGAPPSPDAKASVTLSGDWAARLSEAPPVSCICPTYARVELLEEAIQSFLQQDYPGKKELIVLNDYAAQTLELDHPEVRIVNLPERFGSVGEKYQAAVALASHDLLFVWHDDDIYLPHRLSFSVAQFRQQRGFFKAARAWCWDDGQVSGPERNTFHGGSCFSRELFVAAQGYPHKSDGFGLDGGYDVGFERACEEQRTGATRGESPAPEDLYYIYRWTATGSYHLSAAGQEGEGYDAVAAYVREQAAQGLIKSGPITLRPHWKTDYAVLVRDHLSSGRAKPDEGGVFPPPYFVIPGPKPMDEAAAAALFKGTHPFKISVILPALNESVLLQRTVEQFEATLPPGCEIIVVDNGSIDGCADFLAGGGHPLVTLIHSAKPLGVSGARNRGLDAARGEVIVFVDSHVDVPERWWQPVVATLNRPNVGVVGAGIGVMGKLEDKVSCGQRIAESSLRVEWLPWKQSEPHPVPTLGGAFMAMHRETLERAGAFDLGMPQWGSEDLELCLRYWLLGYEVWVVPEVIILHYFRSENPLKIRPGIVTHNQLRVALLHLGQARLDRVVSALKREPDFGSAMAHAVDSDAWARRAELATARVRNDDWFFELFKASCVA